MSSKKLTMSNNHWRNHGASNGAYFVPGRTSRFAAEEPTPLIEFKQPQDGLRAILGAAITSRNNYMVAKKVHGGITVNTIMIRPHSKARYVTGYLIDPSRCTNDPTFQSFKTLSNVLDRKTTVPLDYLDDLESFFYVLAWMCYTFDGEVGGRHYRIPAHQCAPALTCWATHPTSRESVLEKEAMLMGTGIMYPKCPVSNFWGGEIMHELLDNMHYIIGNRYNKKIELTGFRDDVEIRTSANADYTAVIESIKWALYQWERRG